MAQLETASVEQLRRLLEFFPAGDLKDEWVGLKGLKKDDVCAAVAKTKDAPRIAKFVLAHFGRCRQHVILTDRPADLPDLMTAFPPSDLLGQGKAGASFFLSVVPYTVYLLNPMEDVQVDVLWPIKIDVREKVIIVRFIVLERDPANYTGRTLLKSVRDIDEKKILQDLSDLGCKPLDINQGVKALWESKYMDASRSSYKKAKSTSTEVMDEGVGLREHDPALYKDITAKPLLNHNFKIAPEIMDALGIFQINPTFGRIGFTSYTENPGDADAVIEAILAGNS